MEINPLITRQICEAAIMLFSGLAVMLCFEIFQALKKTAKPRKLPEFILDILFYGLAALITVEFLNYADFGRLSFRSAAAWIAGLILWKKCFYGTIHKKE